MKNKSFISLIALGLVAIVGSGIGFGINATRGSDESLSIPAGPAQATVSVPHPGPAQAEVAARTTQPAPKPREATSQSTLEADPNFERALREAGICRQGWKTDFSRHTVAYREILSGGPPRDGIPPLDNPSFTTPKDASVWLGDQEPVIAFELNGDARAYPLQILTWHEIVNDEVGGVPVAATFCPLCNAAIVFDRTLGGVVYDFGTSGKLRNSDLIMWDRQTETWWPQFTGEGIVGELAGKQLTFLAATIVSFSDFRTANPDGKVLSRETGFSRSYGQNPYAGYDRADNPPFLFRGDLDGRLLPKERVATVSVGGVDVAFPVSVLAQEKAVNYTVNAQDLVVLFKPGTASALDQSSISESRDVGATGLFDARVNGQKLTFRADGDNFVDGETGSVWTILGQAVDGPLTGERLSPIVHANHFWFAWGAFKPETLIYQGAG